MHAAQRRLRSSRLHSTPDLGPQVGVLVGATQLLGVNSRARQMNWQIERDLSRPPRQHDDEDKEYRYDRHQHRRAKAKLALGDAVVPDAPDV